MALSLSSFRRMNTHNPALQLPFPPFFPSQFKILGQSWQLSRLRRCVTSPRPAAGATGEGDRGESRHMQRRRWRERVEEGDGGVVRKDERGGWREGKGVDAWTRTAGSTVVVGKEEVVVANCGDSRAVLCRGDVAVPLSVDHKPDRPDEKERVEAAGGRIIDWNGSRVLGVLATSRSIGDYYLKPFVIAEPEVTVSKRTELDDFLVIASDGLWDALSNEVACQVVRRCLNGRIKRRFPEELRGSNAAEAAAVLAELAMARGSQDNISVIVVELKKPNSKSP